MKSKICNLITIMSFLTLLVIVLAACAPKSEPTEEVVVVEAHRCYHNLGRHQPGHWLGILQSSLSFP